MSTKVQRWGNSLAVRIPDDVVEDAGFVPGTEVTVQKVRNTVVIAHVKDKRKRPTLAELVAKITPENRHDYQWNDVEPMGKEIW